MQRDGQSPFIDLRPLLDLPQWFHALQVLRDTGSGMAIADLLRQEGEPASHVLVEVNRTFVSPGEHQDRVLVEGDDVEIILPAFGG